MPVAVVDTGVLIGRVDADDPQHEVATEIVRGIDQAELPTGRVTNYVLLETLNWIHARKHHQRAVETYRRLNASAGFELVQAAQRDFGRAVEFFETYEALSFGDAIIAAYMERTGLESLYSFDDDFDGVEHVTRLPTADDPYA